jgi:hypothetical protein
MPRRLISLLLLTVFLGAGTTLPGPDVLVHHWGVGQNQRAHIEPAGGCSSHAGHCTLGRTATGAGASIADAPVLRTEPLAGTALRLVPPTVVAGADHITLPQSRAPPAPVG